jgi:hypothetical protein
MPLNFNPNRICGLVFCVRECFSANSGSDYIEPLGPSLTYVTDAHFIEAIAATSDDGIGDAIYTAEHIHKDLVMGVKRCTG